MVNKDKLDVRKSLTVIIEPTHECNLSCKYCYVDKNAEKGRMNNKTLKNSIQKIAIFHGKGIKSLFEWHGGEPLLVGLDFFKEVINVQKEMGVEYEFENSIQTNGTLITEEIADFFKENNFFVGLSLDGPRALNNKTRRYKNGRGTFGDILRSIGILRERGMEVGTIVTLNKQNIKDVKLIYQFLKEYKINAKFNPIVKSSRAIENYEELAISPEEFEEARLELFDMWFNDKQSPHLYCFESTLKNILSKNHFHECTFSDSCQKDFISIGPQGDAYPCGEFDGNKKFRYGNINEGSLEAIFSHPMRKKLLKRAESIEECKDCDYQKLCGGGCMRNAYAFSGNVMDKDPYCPAYKSLFRHISNKIFKNECKEVKNENT